MPSQTKENYLKAIYFLADEEGKIAVSVLSKEMGVSIPTANSMVKRLQQKGWIVYEKYKPLQLTKNGRKTAALIIRKHRIAEMFLVEKMGFGWEEVHDIAEELEHIDSNALFDRMDEMLNYPAFDPHGSPIPDKNGEVVQEEYFKLSEIEVGNRVRLCALNDSSTELLLFLNSKRIKLGTEMEIQKVEPFDKSVFVTYNDFPSTMLSEEVSKHLLVKVI